MKLRRPKIIHPLKANRLPVEDIDPCKSATARSTDHSKTAVCRDRNPGSTVVQSEKATRRNSRDLKCAMKLALEDAGGFSRGLAHHAAVHYGDHAAVGLAERRKGGRRAERAAALSAPGGATNLAFARLQAWSAIATSGRCRPRGKPGHARKDSGRGRYVKGK